MNNLNSNRVISHPLLQNPPGELDLTEIIKTFWRGRFVIMLSVILACLVGGLYAYKIASPMYPAKAVVALEIKQRNVVNIESVVSSASGGSEEINTEVEVIKSRYLIEALVKKLNLAGDPEFNVTLRNSGKPTLISFWKGIFHEYEEKHTQVQIFNTVVDSVTTAILASNIRNSLAFSIHITTENPEKSALIVNTLADLYIQDSLDTKLAATENASKRLSKKAAELKYEWEVSEAQLKRFSDKTQLVSPEALGTLSIRLKEMRIRISELDAKRSRLKTEISWLERASEPGDIHNIVSQLKNVQIKHAVDELAEGSITQAVFDIKFAKILNNLQQEAKRIDLQYTTLMASEKLLITEIDVQSTDLIKLQQLRHEAQTNGLLYDSFLTRLKETIVQQGFQESDSRLLSRAVPKPAISPNKGVIITLSALLGCLFGTGFVLLREYNNDTFRTAHDIEFYTGYKVLGFTPLVKPKDRIDILAYMMNRPISMFSEAVRNLRTSILLSEHDKPPQVLMMTSSVPDEGKTMQTLALAYNLAELGKKVVILECDIRKRTISKHYQRNGHLGFMSILFGGATLDEVVYKPAGTKIDILCGNRTNKNAADVFASPAFAGFISMLRKKYDYIIIDTAPVLVVPDARIIGQHADASLYVVLWNSTAKLRVKQGLAMFRSVGLRVGGLILSGVDNNAMKNFGAKNQFGYDDASGYYEN
jgi:succinoglycan biosynthesis transport protein ExoP